MLTRGNWLAGFPLPTFLELGAYRNAVGSARGHVRNVLTEWGLGDFTDAVILIVSELVTNAVNATSEARWAAGLPPVRLWVLGGAGSAGTGEILVLVWDAVRELPKRGTAGEEDESGRGLGIVHTLSGAQWTPTCPPTRPAERSPERSSTSPGAISRRGKRGDCAFASLPNMANAHSPAL